MSFYAHAGSVLFAGVLGGLLVFFFEDGLATEIQKNKWVLPILGGLSFSAIAMILFPKYF